MLFFREVKTWRKLFGEKLTSLRPSLDDKMQTLPTPRH
jgi:hypothetical protein